MSRRARAGRRAPSDRGEPLAAALELLGLDFPGLRARSYKHAVELLEQWKREVLKPAWKKAARSAHPDRHPGDPGAAERFKALKAAYDLLSDLEAPPPPRARVEVSRAIDEAVLEALRRTGGARMGRPRAGKTGVRSTVTVHIYTAFEDQ